jgi:hypothetical protein
MKRAFVLLLIPSLSWAACDIPAALQALTPGAAWNLSGTTYSGLVWLDEVQVEPTALQVSAAQAPCIANQSQVTAWQVELSTTEAAVALAAPTYVAASAVGQIQVNRNMARIIQLKQLLGIP